MVQIGRGAEWGLWDLHVHTPSSLVHHYGGDTDETWEQFLSDLEALPPDFHVIGINDYWFLDGYRRVREARSAGRLANLKAVFPVLELRIPQFGGSGTKLSRVNLHVIFDPDLDPDVIEQQFISALTSSFQLSPGADAASWSGAITRDSLAELGKAIKATVPEEELHRFGTDLIEGFNNLNVSLDQVRSTLDRSFLRGRHVVGIGKAEWADVKWNDQTIASKKDVINRADLIFTAYQGGSDWHSDVEKLTKSLVNNKILDCSDAHDFSTSKAAERIGHCSTWMNTTPTLAGLKHALAEFDRRVFVGLEPPILGRINRNPERFIDSVGLASSDPSKFPVFGYDLPLNPGFVAIVGNKGQGKSALLDCIALAGNSPRTAEFAFLNPQRFLSSTNRAAKEYTSTLTWRAGSTRSKALDEGHERSTPVSVEYLPQRFVERVCSADLDSEEADEFERELRDVLFTHIPEDERAGEATFDSLLATKSRASESKINRLRSGLRPLVAKYMALVELQAAEDLADLDARLLVVRREIVAAEKALDEATRALADADQEAGDDAGLVTLRAKAEAISRSRRTLEEEETLLMQASASDRQRLLALDSVLQRAEGIAAEAGELNDEAMRLMSSATPLVDVKIDTDSVAAWKQSRQADEGERQSRRATIGTQLGELLSDAAEVDAALAKADSISELARQRVLQAQVRLSDLRGDPSKPESEAGLQALRDLVGDAPGQVRATVTALLDVAKEIHKCLVQQLGDVSSLYAPATEFIDASPVLRNAGLEFNAGLRVGTAARSFAASLDGRKSPDLQEWAASLPDAIDPDSWEDISGALASLITRLAIERGEEEGAFRDPSTALRAAVSLEDFLTRMFDLAWLDVRFGLTGDGLPLTKLSPGQRGLVLVLFYLVIDRRTTPLLLDQPEENLDNETIANRLVPALHEAAGRRQTIVVTHNANLAIVGDADQVVHCQWDGSRFAVEAGCISEFKVAQFAVDILEGTKPAFSTRSRKYEAFPDLK